MIDCAKVIRAYLQTAATALYTLCATRIYIIPPGQPHPLAVAASVSFQILPLGGPIRPVKLEEVYAEFHCWAGVPDTAQEVAQALDTVLHNKAGLTVTIGESTYLIATAERITALPVEPDPISHEWFRARCQYRLVLRSETT